MSERDVSESMNFSDAQQEAFANLSPEERDAFLSAISTPEASDGWSDESSAAHNTVMTAGVEGLSAKDYAATTPEAIRQQRSAYATDPEYEGLDLEALGNPWDHATDADDADDADDD